MAKLAQTVAKVAAGAGIAALALISNFEGESLPAYRDSVGTPTICIGHTYGVRMGQKATHEQCQVWLQDDADKAWRDVLNIVRVPISQNELDAYTSFVFNVGIARFNSSTMLRKLNAGDHTGACNELPRWVYADGKRLPGLVARRAAEQKLCLTPDNQ